jgi:hypothetical protein
MGALKFILFLAIACGLVYAGWTVFDPDRGQDPTAAVRTALQHTTTTADLSDRIEHALKLGVVDDAVMFADTARFAGIPITAEAQEQLANETTNARKMMRGAGDFINGFFAREEVTPSGLAGEVTSDVTLSGDIDDIEAEAGKMRVGIDYDEMLLSLAIVGAAINGETAVPVGGVLPARVDLSVIKVAKRGDLLTQPFVDSLMRPLRAAADMPRFRLAIHDIDLADRGALKSAVADYAKTVQTAGLTDELSKVGVLRKAAGTGETILLLHEVSSTGELAELARMSTALGNKTRAVIAITGKKSLRLFGDGPDYVAMLKANPISFAAWGGALICLVAGFVAARRPRYVDEDSSGY